MIFSKKICIGILGLGYIGLPLAVEFSKKFKVIHVTDALLLAKKLFYFFASNTRNEWGASNWNQNCMGIDVRNHQKSKTSSPKRVEAKVLGGGLKYSGCKL